MSRFYNKRAWQRLRAAKLAADPLCEYHPDGSIAMATDVDHRIPINRGGDRWAWDNLASACHECHSHKTRQEQLGLEHTPARVKGVDAHTGVPLDAAHWWRTG